MEVLDYEFCLYVWLRMHCISPIFFYWLYLSPLVLKEIKKTSDRIYRIIWKKGPSA